VKGSESGSTRGRAFTSSEQSSTARDSQFVRLALAGEAGLALLAVGLGRVLGFSPLAVLQPSWRSLLWGLLATPPLLLALIWVLQRPSGPLKQLVDFVVSELGPILARRSAAELALLAGLAGVGEELLFRGLLQAGLMRVVPTPLALVSASALFGLAHFATSTYAIVAGLMGLYLGGVFLLQGSLFAPIVTHAVYDFVALVLVVRRHRASQGQPVPE
jgi:membrane protease YdiL (CAAX protease family)